MLALETIAINVSCNTFVKLISRKKNIIWYFSRTFSWNWFTKKIKILTIITLCVAWMVISLYFFPGLSHFIYICVVAKKKKTVESAADKVTGPTRCLRHLMQSLANFPRILLIQDLWLLSLSFHPEIENNLVFRDFLVILYGDLGKGKVINLYRFFL